MKAALLMTLIMSLNPFAHGSTYCIGESYRSAYDFFTNYAVRCGREKSLRYFDHQKKNEIVSKLAAEGINFVRSIGPQESKLDIYKIGKIEKDDAASTQLLFRFVGKHGWDKTLLESIQVWTGKFVIRYDDQKGAASDYRHVEAILNDLDLVNVGAVNAVDPHFEATSNVANEVLIVKNTLLRKQCLLKSLLEP